MMDASPVAQLSSRQQPLFALSRDDISPLSQSSRLNPLQRGPFSRSFTTSFGSFSSSSRSKSGSSATSVSSLGSGYFDLNARPKRDLPSPMACLTADMSANFSLDPRLRQFLYSVAHSLVRAHGSPLLAAPSSRLCRLVRSSPADNRPCVRLLLMSTRRQALIQILLLTHRYLTRYQLLHKRYLPIQTPPSKTSSIKPIFQFVLLLLGSKPLLSVQYLENPSTVARLKQILKSPLLYSKSPACTNFR